MSVVISSNLQPCEWNEESSIEAAVLVKTCLIKTTFVLKCFRWGKATEQNSGISPPLYMLLNALYLNLLSLDPIVSCMYQFVVVLVATSTITTSYDCQQWNKLHGPDLSTDFQGVGSLALVGSWTYVLIVNFYLWNEIQLN